MSSEPRNAVAALVEKAKAELQSGAFEEAIESFTACLAVAPDEVVAHQGRGLAYFQLSQWKKAQTDFQEAKRLDPADPENAIGLAMSLAMDNQVYPAIGIFEDLIAAEPNCVRAYIQLGLLHLKLGVINKGREHLKNALQHRPSLVERRLIESNLNEQSKLDAKRYYRPDFEALRKKRV